MTYRMQLKGLTMRTLGASTLCAMLFGSAGCFSFGGGFGSPWDEPEESETPETELPPWFEPDFEETERPEAAEFEGTILGANLRGDFGHVKGIDQMAQRIGTWGDSYATTVEMAAQGPQGAAMTVLYIEGGLDHPELLKPGATFSFTEADLNERWQNWDGTSTQEELFISAVGCSGETDYNWAWDVPADEVDVDVEENPEKPGVLLVNYTAHFPTTEVWIDDDNGGRFELIEECEVSGTVEVDPTNTL